MQNYEARKPSYFATPSPQLVRALHTSLTQILSAPLDYRFQKHKEVSQKVKKAVAELGLRQLADKPECQANGMTAIYLPEGVAAPDLLPKLTAKGVVFAGGLHKEIGRIWISLKGNKANNNDLQLPNTLDWGIWALVLPATIWDTLIRQLRPSGAVWQKLATNNRVGASTWVHIDEITHEGFEMKQLDTSQVRPLGLLFKSDRTYYDII